MKYLLTIIVVVLSTVSASSQVLRTSFRIMPDSITPYLTANNRLDMLDFIDSGMKARVTNSFDGTSELLSLTDSVVTLRLSSSLAMTVRLVPAKVLSETYGMDLSVVSTDSLLCVEKSYGTDSSRKSVTKQYYSLKWRKIDTDKPFLVK